MTEQNPLVSRYLETFRAQLGRLPQSERDELVNEIASHISEAVKAGQPIAEVLERLGPADRLARAYVADQLLREDTGGSKAGRWLAVAGIIATTSLASIIVIPTLGGIGIGFTVGGIAAIIAGIASFALPGLINAYNIWIPVPWGVPQVAAIIVGVVLFGLGCLAFWGLVAYIKFLIRAIRRI